MPRMSARDVEDFLAEPSHLVRIGTVDPDGAPLVVPTWFLHRDGRILITPRATSDFFLNILAEPRVCLSIDEESQPYRKVTIRARADVVYRPGEDDRWRELYRDIVVRYLTEREADAYLKATRKIKRALIGVPLELGRPGVSTWRVPVRGEDPSGIWARKYWEGA